MSDITTLEADKIITEFMGQCWHGHIINGECQQCFTLLSGKVRTIYSKSLDALVPVWEKLDVRMLYCGFNYTDRSTVTFQVRPDLSDESICQKDGKTIQEAAAIATAKAILGIKDKE